MSTIKVLDLIRWDKMGLRVEDVDGHLTALHQQQGSLDGACAVYSIVMALLAQGALSKDDLDIDVKFDKRTIKGKFLSLLMEEQGFVRDGYNYTRLTSQIKEYEKDLGVTVEHRRPSKDHAKVVKCYIDDNVPVVISVENSIMCHALLAVAYEMDDNGNISKLLCLDPGNPEPVVSPWNSFIDVSGKSKAQYPFWFSTTKSLVKLDDMIAVHPAEDE